MFSFVATLALLATVSASVLPTAPLVAAPAVAPFAAPIVTARSSQVIARNYNLAAAPVAYAAPAAFASPYVAPTAFASPFVAPAAFASPYVAPAPLGYSSPIIGAPVAPAVPSPVSPYFLRR